MLKCHFGRGWGERSDFGKGRQIKNISSQLKKKKTDLMMADSKIKSKKSSIYLFA